MNDDFTSGDRHGRGSRPFGPGERSRSGGSGLERLLEGLSGSVGSRSGLFERIANDVSSWFEDEGRTGKTRWRDADADDYGHPRGDARPDHGPASPSSRKRTPAGDAAGSARAGSGHEDGYADESDDASGSLRGRGPKNYRRTDERIAELVNDALRDDDALDASDIEVSVEDGDVTLGGSVPLRRQKHRAENLAVRAAGVHDVDNRLRVRRVAGDEASSAAAGGTPGEARRDADDYGHPA